MSNITWNIDGMKKVELKIKESIEYLIDVKEESSSIKIPDDFENGELVKSFSQNVEKVMDCLYLAKKDVVGIINKFKFAEMRNKTITQDLLKSLYKESTGELYFDKDIKYSCEYLTNENKISYGICWPQKDGKKVEISKVVFYFGGKGQQYITDPEVFKQSEFLGVVQNSNITVGNILIVEPHMKWIDKDGDGKLEVISKEDMQDFIQQICKEANVTTQDCHAMAFSSGGIELQKLEEVANNFGGGITFVDTECYASWMEKIDVPTNAYASEYGRYKDNLQQYIDDVKLINAAHLDIVETIYSENSNKDNKSDLWNELFKSKNTKY